MANNSLHVWSSSTAQSTNIDTKSTTGFAGGDLLKSGEINKILKEVSLVTKALIEQVASSAETISSETTLANVKTALLNGIKGIKVNEAASADYATRAGNANSADQAGEAATASVAGKASNDDDGDSIKATYGASLVQGSANNKVKLKNKNNGSLGEVTINNVANATNATYATKIGTSSSHPGIGASNKPVYVDSNGNVTQCTGIAVDQTERLTNQWTRVYDNTYLDAECTYLFKVIIPKEHIGTSAQFNQYDYLLFSDIIYVDDDHNTQYCMGNSHRFVLSSPGGSNDKEVSYKIALLCESDNSIKVKFYQSSLRDRYSEDVVHDPTYVISLGTTASPIANAPQVYYKRIV